MAKHISIHDLDFSRIIHPHDTVHWGQAAAEPLTLIERLNEQHRPLAPFNIFVGIGYGPGATMEWDANIGFSSYCGTGNNRRLSAEDRLAIVPCHYSALPKVLAERVDVLLLQLSGPDALGRYSFGLAHENLVSLVDSARFVVAEVNKQAPFTFGERFLHEHDLDLVVRTDRAPIELKKTDLNDVERHVGRNVAALIEDGSTLQIGIGTLPEAVLSFVSAKHIGIHSGAIGDAVVDLIKAGIVTNEMKTIDTGLTIAGFLAGTQRLYEFAHLNQSLGLRSTDYTHSPAVLARIDRFTSINSALEVDITGQVNCESATGSYVGTIGGSLDFIRGAHHSKGGLPIVALTSTVTTRGGVRSRIVPALTGPATIPRADVGLIVTEHGVADLRRKSLRERAEALISIASPVFRDELRGSRYFRSIENG